MEIASKIIDILLEKAPVAVWGIAGGFVVWMFFIVKNHLKSLTGKVDKVEARLDSIPYKKHIEKLSWIEKKADDTQEKLTNLPCSKHSKIIDGLTENKSAVSVNVTEIKTSIAFMQKTLDSLTQYIYQNTQNATPFTQTQSPLTITDKGSEMLERMGLHDMLNNNWDRISYFLEENSISKNPYDIQQFCLEQTAVFPEKFLREAELNKIKIDAYNKGFQLIEYMRVLAVLVRDRYFEEHNIDVGDVDKHDPENGIKGG